ncbi:PAS domain-containing protein [Nisaea sp.]|uniref:PAS domain-containing protein n=1 Tax=Nisaea sp. TaxID=2024842 RepID=UPI002B275E0E|nr:PAS domain-containing protein [Nisaea sp.]
MNETGKEKALTELRRRIPHANDSLFAFFGAWLDARGDALVPQRKAFSPNSIPSLLPFVWIYRFDLNRGDFVCQLAGETVNGAWGKIIRGRTLCEIVGTVDYPAMRGRWLEIVGRPALMYGAVEEKLASQETWRAERLMLPMSSSDGTIDVVLGLSLYTLQHRAPGAQTGASDFTAHYSCSDFR